MMVDEMLYQCVVKHFSIEIPPCDTFLCFFLLLYNFKATCNLSACSIIVKIGGRSILIIIKAATIIYGTCKLKTTATENKCYSLNIN